MKPLSHADLLRAADPARFGRGVYDAAHRSQRRDASIAAVQCEADRLRSSGRWKRLRMLKLRATPLCQECERHGATTPASDVDHETPVVELLAQGRAAEVFALERLNSLCRSCHNVKTARERNERRGHEQQRGDVHGATPNRGSGSDAP